MPGTPDRAMVTFSEIDSARFGVRVARAHIVSDSLATALDFCTRERIDLLVARCGTGDLKAVQAMGAERFLLMDTLLYYSFDLRKRKIPEERGEVRVRRLQRGDEAEIPRVAAAAFKGYMGHYHADRRLDPRQCDEAYRSWAERSCIPGEAADGVLVAEAEGKVAGFATLRLNSPREVEGLLYAVAPESQGQGICPLLMIHSLHWSRDQGADRMVISTQVTNVSMQKVWCRTGFEPSHSYYTYHRWFTGEEK